MNDTERPVPQKHHSLNVILLIVGLIIASLSILLIVYQGRSYSFPPYSGFFPFNLGPVMISAYRPAWSPDGSQIAFECVYYQEGDHKDYGPPSDYQLSDICIVNKDGQQLRRITQGRNKFSPAWSADGRYLAWWDGKTYSIDVWDLHSAYPLAYRAPDNFMWGVNYGYDRLEWSKDGTAIFIQGEGVALKPNSSAWRKDPNYDALKDIGHGFAWSPDGSATLFAQRSGKSFPPEYFLNYYVGGALKMRKPTEVNLFTRVSWNQAAGLIAWSGYIVSGGESSLFLTDATSGQTIEVKLPIQGDWSCQRPLWVDGGSGLICYDTYLHVVYHLTLSGQPDPFDYRVANMQEHDLCGEGHVVDNLSWSPENRAFLFQDGADLHQQGKIWVMTLDGKCKKIAP